MVGARGLVRPPTAIDDAGTGILLGTGAPTSAEMFPLLMGPHVSIAPKKTTTGPATHTTAFAGRPARREQLRASLIGPAAVVPITSRRGRFP